MSNDLSVRRISIQERARVASKTAIGAWLAEPYPNQADERAATEVKSALRGLLLDLQWEIEGHFQHEIEHWSGEKQQGDAAWREHAGAEVLALQRHRTAVLALIAGLLEAK